MTDVNLRRALAADADEIGRLMAAAFHDYAWTRWTVDARDHVGHVEALQRLAFTELTLPFGEAWIVVDETAGIVSAAMWMRPDLIVPDAVWRSTAAAQAELEGDRHAASVKAEGALEPHRPTVPHYYLGAVGTLPSHQRRGYGRAVLEPVLDRLADEGVSASLETCGAENVAFYARLGFAVTARVDLDSGGPTVWLMSR